MLNTFALNTLTLGPAGAGALTQLYIWGSDDTVTDDTVALEYDVTTRAITPSRDNRVIHVREIAVDYIGALTVTLIINGTSVQTKTCPAHTTRGVYKFKSKPGLFAGTVAFRVVGDDELFSIGLVGAEEIGVGR